MQENQILWDITAMLLQNKTSDPAIESYIADCINPLIPIIHQRPSNNGSHSDYMSHDQFTAFLVYAEVSGNHEFSNLLYNLVKKQGFLFYDNINPENGWLRIIRGLFKFDVASLKKIRFLHPRDLIFLARCNKKWWANLLLSLDFLITAVEFATVYKIRGTKKMLETDGKILRYLKWNVFQPYFTTEYILLKLLKLRSPAFENLYDCIYHYHRKGQPEIADLCRDRISDKYKKYLGI